MSGFSAAFPAIRELIRRPIVALSAFAAVGFVAISFVVAQGGFNRLSAANYRISVAQGRQAQLAQYLRLTVDLDAAQRDFLLTGEQSLLQPYQNALPQLEPLLAGLTDSYVRQHDTAGAESVRKIRELSRVSVQALDATLRIYRERGIDSARALAAAGAVDQAQLLALVGALLNEELVAVQEAARRWERDLADTRALAVMGSVLNVLLVLIAAMLMARDRKSVV